MIETFDTHAHLDDGRLQKQWPAVLARAQAAGVTRMIAVGIDEPSSRRCLALARNTPGIWASAGIHPNHVAEAAPTEWSAIVELAQETDVVAIGETGLDRHWDRTPWDAQVESFRMHIQLSRAVGKPLIIHAREAEAQVVALLAEDHAVHGPVRAVLHSYTGTIESAAAGLKLGCYVSFAGMLTYPAAENVRQVAATVPRDRLLIETDCPYLAPVPHRGKTNEPAFVVATAGVLATVQGCDLAELARQTTQNARMFFGV
ncbi:MAG: TatD family hydrolase [Gemmataceae bacterium]